VLERRRKNRPSADAQGPNRLQDKTWAHPCLRFAPGQSGPCSSRGALASPDLPGEKLDRRLQPIGIERGERPDRIGNLGDLGVVERGQVLRVEAVAASKLVAVSRRVAEKAPVETRRERLWLSVLMRSVRLREASRVVPTDHGRRFVSRVFGRRC
jgi:hypothetical protein